jgi:uncharacterized protein YyaL (SSP411 family)
MAHESFEDPAVAALMNEAFVSVKVDREERPDIDNVYMTVCQMLTGSGGWPLTIIMTPDKKPFFAGTYFPKENRFGRIGMLELVPKIRDLWTSRRDELVQSADKITRALQETAKVEPGEGLGLEDLKKTYEQLSAMFDTGHGGFGGKPKFPTPHNLLFLLRYWRRFDEKDALAMAEKTLQAMRMGGIYDHVGFGFHRYATDAEWLVPHFEKMLYDQALLALSYAEAYQATRKAEYRRTAEEIFTYVLRDMRAPGGGFYSAEDADSEGEEGKFYLWTEEELRALLGKSDADLAVRVFNVSREGNFFEEASGQLVGKSILHLKKPIGEIASDMKLTEERLESRLEGIRKKLFRARKARIHPHKDDKILTDWCGLMIAALARGGRVFEEDDYTAAAEKAADFIMEKMRGKDGRLLHRYRDGEAGIPALVDDYAFFIWGLLELYESTFDTRFLETAVRLQEDMLRGYWDDGTGGFFFTADDGEALLVRQKDIYDGAIPSGNAVGMLNLLRLGRMTARPDFEEKAQAIAKTFRGQVAAAPSGYTLLLSAVDFGVGPSYEVVIAGRPGAEDTGKMIRVLRETYLPNKVVLFRPTDRKKPDIVRLSAFTEFQAGIDGKAAAYVCRDYQCEQPLTDADAFRKVLAGGP